jgi:hypothetical protein
VVRISVDRSKASDLGINMAQVGATLQTLLGGNYVNRFNLEGRSYQVIPQVPRGMRLSPESLGGYYVPTNTGQLVPLSTIVSIETATDPNSLTHYNQLNSATFSAVPMPGVTVGQAVDFLEGEAKKLPAGFGHDYLADSRQYVQEGNQLAITFGFALVIIFLVLAAQFESLRDPLVIMISVPMAIVGALIPLFFGVATINIYTQVGLLTLVGLITKHGILMVEFANELQLKEGLDKRSAIEMAARIRLRPILMTTAAMVTGLIPLLTATGAGAAEPLLDRSRRGRGHVDRHAVHAVRAAGGLCLDGHRPPGEGRLGADQGDRRFRSREDGAQADLSLSARDEVTGDGSGDRCRRFFVSAGHSLRRRRRLSMLEARKTGGQHDERLSRRQLPLHPGRVSVFRRGGCQPGYEIERVRFDKWVPLAEGFAQIAKYIQAAGRPLTSFCACELRSPAAFTDEGISQFQPALRQDAGGVGRL